MQAHDDNTSLIQLRQMNDQLGSLIVMADTQGDSLLGALLCEARDHVARQVGDARPV